MGLSESKSLISSWPLIFWRFYGLIFRGLTFLTEVLGLANKYPQLRQRYLTEDLLDGLRKERAEHQECFVVFASSAGEYEQALPLVAKLRETYRSCLIVMVVFSESGIHFAKKQNSETVVVKAPWDNFNDWYRLFEILKPKASFIVRYELWPGFMKAAHRCGPLYLINASMSRRDSVIGLWLKKKLFKKIKLVFLVGEDDRSYFKLRLGLTDEQLIRAGDTKYERVLQRRVEFSKKFEGIRDNTDQLWLASKRRIIIGSCWPADLELFLRLKAMGFPMENWNFIVAPHDVSEKSLGFFEQALHEAGLQSCRYSQKENLTPSYEVLLIDVIGLLPELYGIADIAFVGGANHYRVHNVLEPAAWARPIAFGPHHTTSKEARMLVKESLATVVDSADGLGRWIHYWNHNVTLSKESGRIENIRLVAYTKKMAGASHKIIERLAIENKKHGKKISH